jgi:hypothetical protein
VVVASSTRGFATFQAGTPHLISPRAGYQDQDEKGSVTEIRRLTKEQMASFGYSMAELRQLARDRGVPVPRDALHHVVVRTLAAGVRLPPKQAA